MMVKIGKVLFGNQGKSGKKTDNIVAQIKVLWYTMLNFNKHLIMTFLSDHDSHYELHGYGSYQLFSFSMIVIMSLVGL